MKTSTQTFAMIGAIALAACGDTQTSSPVPTQVEAMNHGDMDHSQMTGDTGHTTGRIISISPDGQEVTINHAEIKGVGMDAMTMGFTVLSDVDLKAFTADQNVSFMVKKGRDGSYRITAMCDTEVNGADCLSSNMDHSGH